MKITVNRKDLLAKLGVVKSGVSGRSSLAILSHVLLVSEDDSLTLSTTDLELAVSAKLALPAMSDAGSVAVPLVQFTQILSGLSTHDVDIKTDKLGVIVSTGKSKYTLHSMPGEEFPKPAEVNEAGCFEIEGKVLQGGLKEVSPAVSTDTNRAILTGVLLVRESDEEIKMVATDTHRLVVTSKKPLLMTGEWPNVILPGRFVKELISLLGEDVVSFEVGKVHVQVTIGDTVLISRLIEGQFPNYQRVIPAGSYLEWTFQVSDLLPAVKRCAIVAKESSERVVFSMENGVITLSAESQMVGFASEQVEARIENKGAGTEFQTAFNAKYLQDMLNSVPSEKVILKLTDPLKPAIVNVGDMVVTNEDKSQSVVPNTSYLHVLMPMQIV